MALPIEVGFHSSIVFHTMGGAVHPRLGTRSPSQPLQLSAMQLANGTAGVTSDGRGGVDFESSAGVDVKLTDLGEDEVEFTLCAPSRSPAPCGFDLNVNALRYLHDVNGTSDKEEFVYAFERSDVLLPEARILSWPDTDL